MPLTADAAGMGRTGATDRGWREEMDRETLETMLQQGNDNAMLHYTLGSLLLKEGEPEQAVMHLEQAVALDPRHSASWKLYGRALMKSDRPGEAIAAYRKGIAVAEERGDIQAVKEMQVFLKRLTRSD